MRILLVNSARVWGGGETHTASLARGLAARGHEVLLAARPAGAFASSGLPRLDFSLLHLRSALHHQPFDIVHAHRARDYPLVCAAALGLETKVVLTRHLLYPLRRHPLYRRVDGWLAPTSQIAQTLHPLRPPALEVIPNGVDLDAFPMRPYEPRRSLTLGLLGQISPHKGHGDALAALGSLAPSCRLIIAGEGNPAYLARLHRAAVGLPVEFRGAVPAPDFLQTIDALLVPSWEEPFGIVVLEAMASGVPVVATNTGGPAELLAGDCGALVPARDPAALAAAVRALIDHPEAAAARARRARARVESGFDIREVVRRVEAFYLRLLGVQTA